MRNHKIWSREEAIAFGQKGRQTSADRAALKRSLLNSAHPTLSALPPVLDKQITSVTLLLDRAQRKGWSMAAERWSKVLERLVKLRKVSMPSATAAKANGATTSAPSPAMAEPKPIALSTPSPSPTPPTSPAAARPSSLEEPEPLEQSPID